MRLYTREWVISPNSTVKSWKTMRSQVKLAGMKGGAFRAGAARLCAPGLAFAAARSLLCEHGRSFCRRSRCL